MTRKAVRRRLVILSAAVAAVILVDLVGEPDGWILRIVFVVAVSIVLISGLDWLKARRLKARRSR